MRFAYLILAHERFDQLARLVLRLLRDNDDRAYLHVDRRVAIPASFESALSGVAHRVIILPDRVRVDWAHWSQCAATLRLMETALGEEAAYFHLLSGTDWPLVSRDQMVRDIAAAGDKDCLVHLEAEDFAWRMDNFCFEERSLHPGRKALPLLWRYGALVRDVSRRVNDHYRRHGLARSQPLGPWVKGSQWWSLPRDATTYAAARLRALIQSNRLRYTQCSDEHVIQTALARSEFSTRLADHRRLIRWSEGAWSPQVLRREDIGSLKDSGAWFGRKFYADVDDFFYAL